MSRRLWTTTIILLLFVIGIVVLAFIAFEGNFTSLSVVVLFFAALAVVAFTYLIYGPAMLESAKRQARQMCAAGQIVDPKLHQKLCHRLAAAPHDEAAVELRRKMEELKKK